MEVGESVIFTALYVISQEAALSGLITNTAKAVGSIPGNFNGIEDVSDNGTSTDDDGDGDPDNDPTVVLMDAPPVSSIEVTKEASVVDNDVDNTNSLGDTINYTITVANTGNTDLRDVVLDDVISDLNGDRLTLTSGPSFTSASLGSIEGKLRQGESATYVASFVITQQAIDAGGVSNTVTVVASSPGKTNDIFDISDDGDDTDGNTQNDPTITRTTTITPSSSIVLTKAASISDTNGDGSIGLGDTITYTLVATNTGNDALSSVVITDVLSDLTGNTLSLTTQPTFVSANLGSAEGSLQVGEQATYSATFIVDNQAMNAGGVSNTATVTAQGTNSTVTDTSDDPSTSTPNDPTITRLTTVTPQSSIEVTKTATITDNGNGTTGLGDTITFLITVENTGNTTLSSLDVNDTFSDLSGNSLALTTGPIFVSANLGSSEGTLLAGETATYTATFVVDAQADNAGGVSNTASASAIDSSGMQVNDISDDGDDTDGNTTNDPTVLTFFKDPVDGDFEVFNGMSPGDDGINDYFKIAGIEKYPNNTVKIFTDGACLFMKQKDMVWATDSLWEYPKVELPLQRIKSYQQGPISM